MVFQVLRIILVSGFRVIFPLTTWHLLDVRVAEKEACQYVFFRSALVITIVVSVSCNSSYIESCGPTTDWTKLRCTDHTMRNLNIVNQPMGNLNTYCNIGGP